MDFKNRGATDAPTMPGARPCPDAEPWPRRDAVERPEGSPLRQPAPAIPDPSPDDVRCLMVAAGFLRNPPELRDDTPRGVVE